MEERLASKRAFCEPLFSSSSSLCLFPYTFIAHFTLLWGGVGWFYSGSHLRPSPSRSPSSTHPQLFKKRKDVIINSWGHSSSPGHGETRDGVPIHSCQAVNWEHV